MNGSVQLSPIERQKTLADTVVDQVEEQIRSGGLKVGDRLPSERTLCVQLAVSRTVLREALSALAAKGLVEPNAGGGYLVASPGSELVAESLRRFIQSPDLLQDTHHVFEVREILEVEIAGLAARRRSTDDLAAMDAAQNDFHRAIEANEPDLCAEADVQFHLALARGTQNPMLSLLLEAVGDTMREVRRTGNLQPGSTRRAFQMHRDIQERVRVQDVQGARDAMIAHLREGRAVHEASVQFLKKQRGQTT